MSKLYPCVNCTEDGYCKKYSDEEVKSWCVQGPCEDERPSNADRIRAMTDEELADWLIMNGDGSDYETWLEWLKQEAET